MRATAVALLVVALLAGCFGGGKDPAAGGDGASPTPAPVGSSTSTAAPGEPAVTFSWSPTTPVVNRSVDFVATTRDLGGQRVESAAWTFGDGASGKGLRTNHTYAQPGDWSVRVTVKLSGGDSLSSTASLFVVNTGSPGATPDASAPPPPPPPGAFECEGGNVTEPHATFGTDDALPGLAWAVLKTGFRLAVVWSSESPTVGSLTYKAGQGPGAPVTVTETAPTTLHLLVADGLPEGATVCFTASMDGVTTGTHAVRTVNAMTSFTNATPHGTYVHNLLVLNNEGGDLGEVEAGADRFAQMLWDATDGWVRAGAVLVVNGDPLHANVGWPTCYLVSLPGACTNVFDVLVTFGAAPQGAASTYRQGVREANAAIWMNEYHQAMPGPLSLDDFGAVLLHELGHYSFDMDDLYGDNTVVTSECYDASTGISIMAGSRDATEFDDPATPCPNQPTGYTTSWELLQGQFKQVPDRPLGPLPGPDGDGGTYLRRTYVL